MSTTIAAKGTSRVWQACGGTALGYNCQELIETVADQTSRLAFAHLFGGKSHQAAIDLGEKLAAMVPVPEAQVFFGNSGSDANDTMIKLLRLSQLGGGHPEKRKIIARNGAYHGITIAAACLTGEEAFHEAFDLPLAELGILRTDSPNFFRGHLPGESEPDFV